MFNFLAHTEEVRQEMLNSIGLKSIEDLFSYIAPEIRVNNDLESIPAGLTEAEAKSKLKKLASKNIDAETLSVFAGGGVYNRYIPACIDNIVKRSEFYTAYTPYQPEVSQGTLQVIYEFQTMICNLTGMDVANASVYDGASAVAEAVRMAVRITKKDKVLISDAINPDCKKVVETYCSDFDIDYISLDGTKTDVDLLKNTLNDDYACFVLQNPNYLGSLENLIEIGDLCKNSKAKLIVSTDLVSLSLVNAPDKYNADIVVGEIQQLGIAMAYGGPHAGFIACKTPYLRQMPGRIVGMSLDHDGERAFTLTMQAREQHIRRSKATSNICSNQALVALAATVYMSLVGPEGLKEIITISTQKAHYLSENINKIAGFQTLNSDFLYEFCVKVDAKLSISVVLQELEKENILAGIDVSNKINGFDNCLLICTTEMNAKEQIDDFIAALKNISAKYSL